MKKQKVKRFWATLLAIGVVITTVFPGTTYADEIGTQISEPVKVEEQSDPVEDGEEQTDSEVKPAGDSNILLLSSETVPEDTLGAVAVEQLAGAVRLTYESAEMSKNAFDVFTAMGIACEYDTQVEMLDKEPEKVEELNPTEVPTEDIAVVEELNEEPVAVESASKEKSVKVAVIDTGCDLNVISGRIADGTDMSVTDVNGHGTLMTEIIASQTTEKVKILPIKAFDDNGYSTVGQVYDAIMRAIDLGADVINLSMSGVGSSQMLTHAINKATEKGIIVVVSAGNDASDVEGFMPGNIDSAITVSATDRNEVFAEYSNFGEKIDYSAVGEIIKDQGTEDTSDDTYYSGTSIAAAFVSGYAACVKDNNPEADILGTFDKYAKDLGEAGRDNYYGRGFLALENISFDVNKGENEDSSDDREKITDNTDEKEDDIEDKKSDKKKEKEEKELKTAATTTISVNNAADLQNAFATANSGKTVVANLKANISIDTNMGFLLKNGNLTINGSYTKSDGTKGKRHININFPNYFLNQAYLMTATGTATDKSTLTVKNIVFDAKEQVSCAAGNAIVTTFQSPWLEGKKSTLNVENCNFQNINYGSGGGMNAIEAKGGNLNVKNVNITDNIVLMTGGVTAWEGTNAVTCENVTITGKNKKSVDQGIAISKKSIKGSSTGTVTNCKISNANYGVYSANDAPTLSGGNTLIINNVTATNCNCAGILLDNKSVSATITDADIYDCNNSTYGYGIWIKAGAKATLNPTNGTISIGKRTNGNTASTKTHPNRIGIYNESGTLIVKDDNTADDKKINICWNSDRGIENKGSATVNSANVYNNGILYTTFNGQTDNYKYNTADTCAGIRNVGSGTLSMTGSKVSSNQSKGITSGENASVTLSGVQINGNQGTGFINHGQGTINSGNFYSNAASGVNSTGTLTVNGGAYYSNKSHGIAIGGGTANIYYGTFGTYSNDSGKTWVNVGNASAGIRTKKATTNVYGGVFFYNKNGLECQDGTLNLKYDGTNKRTIYVSANTSNGLYSKGEVKNADGSVNTAGGNITVDANALVNSHSNGSAAIYAGNKAKVTVGAGEYYNSPNGIKVADGGVTTLSGGSVYNNSNGISNAGTVTLSGGDVYGNKKYGVYNNGTFTMSGGKVRDNDDNGTAVGGTKGDGIANEGGIVNISGGTITGNSAGFYNVGTAKVTGGTISSNTYGISNETIKRGAETISGTTTVNGSAVSITGNTRGIQNTADENGVTVNNANMKGNTYDVSQSGKTFTINGNNTKANVIELGVKDGVPEVVTIDGALTEKKTVKFVQNYKNDSYKTANISVGRPMFQCLHTTPKAILDSGKLILQSGQQTLMGNGTKRDAIMRPCKGTNSNDSNRKSEDYIVLSTKYAGIYKVKESLEGVDFKIPDSAVIFWNEKNDIKMPELWATIGGVLKKFDIIGWLKDGLGNPVSVGSIMSFLFGESNRDHEIVAQMGVVNLCVNGNGQSEGENYVIEEFNCVTDTLPQNTFKKEFLDDYYYIELGEQKRHETKYSYQGWSLSDESTYLSEGVMQPQGKLDYADVLTYMDEHKDSITYGDNGLPNIPLYAVWDKYPELQAKDVGIVTGWVDESSGFAKTDAELQEIIFEKVLGTDDEDGTLTNGVEEKGVICTDFDKEEIRQFKHTGTATLTYRATDGVGNVTERKVRLYINSSDPIEPYDLDHPELGGAYPNRARCINRKYYDAGKVSVGLEPTDAHYLDGYRAGGLIPTDRWYTDPEYAAVIEEAFDNLENDTPEFVWIFNHEQVLETQDYIEEHGFGDSEEEGALRRYFDKYKGSFEKLK